MEIVLILKALYYMPLNVHLKVTLHSFTGLHSVTSVSYSPFIVHLETCTFYIDL